MYFKVEKGGITLTVAAISREMLEDLEAMIRRELDGCTRRAADGTRLYTPDGMGNYPALWTRDFAYMLEYAGEFIPPEEMRAGILYILKHARADGWIPDKVDADGVPSYTAGGDGVFARPNLDNGPFLVLAVDAYLRRIPEEEALDFFFRWNPALTAGLEVLPVDENGLVYNEPADPHSPYGFTDCIGKTGSLMMESLLLWQAWSILLDRRREYRLPVGDLPQRVEAIEASLLPTFRSGTPLLLAATADCRQLDIWGSCYAVACGFPLPLAQKRGIARWLAAHYDGLVQDGQLRHTEPGRYWERLLIPVKEGEYQNGAYWATPTGWLAQALQVENGELAARTLLDVCRYFREQGTYECVNGDYRKLNHYVASVTNVYAAVKQAWMQRGCSAARDYGRSPYNGAAY